MNAYYVERERTNDKSGAYFIDFCPQRYIGQMRLNTWGFFFLFLTLRKCKTGPKKGNICTRRIVRKCKNKKIEGKVCATNFIRSLFLFFLLILQFVSIVFLYLTKTRCFGQVFQSISWMCFFFFRFDNIQFIFFLPSMCGEMMILTETEKEETSFRYTLKSLMIFILASDKRTLFFSCVVRGS